MNTNHLSIYEIRKNLVAIQAISDNKQIDNENARGMVSLIASILESEITRIIEEKENNKQ